MSSNLTYYPTPVFKWCCGVYDRRSALMINGVYPIDLYIHINRSILVRCIRRRNAHESGHWRVGDLVSSLWNRIIICSAQLPHGMKMESENLNILHIIQHIGRSVVGCTLHQRSAPVDPWDIHHLRLYRQLHTVGLTSTMNEGRRAKYWTVCSGSDYGTFSYNY